MVECVSINSIDKISRQIRDQGLRFPLILKKKTLLMLWLDDEHNHYEDSVIDLTYTKKNLTLFMPGPNGKTQSLQKQCHMVISYCSYKIKKLLNRVKF